MNKKFFAALASATMAFTASGSIAVFADDFVEEKTPVVDNGDVAPLPETVVWNEDNFGVLVKLAGTKLTGDGLTELKDIDGKTLAEKATVKTADLEKIKNIDFTGSNLEGEIKGLEYFTGLTTFTDAGVKKLTNKTLDFSASTKLTSLTVANAADLAELKLPKADEDEVYHLATLDLQGTKLTALDLSAQEELRTLTVKKSELKDLDLSVLALNEVEVTNNNNLKEVVLNNGRKGKPTKFTTLNLSANALETVNLDYVEVETTLDLSDNHIGVLDLSKTTGKANPTLTGQTFYVSETLENVNLEKTFENFDVDNVTSPTDKKAFDKKTGVLTLEEDGSTEYKYETGKGELVVTLTAANPMNRLYNPNSGEHFYTADLEEKEALVKLGWNDEGYGWVAPTEEDGKAAKTNVFRLYNPNAGDHHYTTSTDERDVLVAYGWKDEGTGWYSDNGKEVAVYRQYNPYANGAGSHNYTTDKAENDHLLTLGWIYEGTAWYGLK